MCEEVNARHAAQPGSGSIALYRRLRLGSMMECGMASAVYPTQYSIEL